MSIIIKCRTSSPDESHNVDVPSLVSVHPAIQRDVRILRWGDTACIYPANGTKYTLEAITNEQNTETNNAILFDISKCNSDHSEIIRSVNSHHFFRKKAREGVE